MADRSAASPAFLKPMVTPFKLQAGGAKNGGGASDLDRESVALDSNSLDLRTSRLGAASMDLDDGSMDIDGPRPPVPSRGGAVQTGPPPPPQGCIKMAATTAVASPRWTAVVAGFCVVVGGAVLFGAIGLVSAGTASTTE